jgi:Glucose-6-phosphate 1-dehydrogenase
VLTFDVKAPGDPFRLATEPLHFNYHEAFGAIPEAYQTLLLDVIEGDQTLFVHADEVEASWRLYTPVLQASRPVYPYAAGSWGPPQADALLKGPVRWRNP